MKHSLIPIFAVTIFFISCSSPRQEDLTQYVDPFIGTAYVGHTHPAAQLPFGMVQVGPDTGTDKWEHCSGYHDADSSIIGFSHTHLSGTGIPEMGDIMFMPVVGNIPFYRGDETDTSTGYRSRFSHDKEEAAPGYYRVLLDDYGITAELTATERVAIHKYTFPQSDQAGIIIDLNHGIGNNTIESSLAILNDTTIAGKRRSSGFSQDRTLYFLATLSKPFTGFSSFSDSIVSEDQNINGKDTKLLLKFDTGRDESLTVKVALSTTGFEGAGKNMEKETAGKDFEQIRSEAAAIWNGYLNKIEISPMDDQQAISFYTSLYHALLMPNLITDVDSTYCLPDGTRIKSDADRYTNFSLWDTYRATHPFYILMFPEKNSEFVASLIDLYKQRGILCTNEYGQNETWLMIGNHAVPVIADAYLKGKLPGDIQTAVASIYASLTKSHPKSDWETYNRLGYYPFDLIGVESVSRTLEHCYDDYCAALVAKQNGDVENQRFFAQRAGNYKNLFDPTTTLARGKDSKGNWRSPFDPFLLSHAGTSGGDYTEGNAWQYTWHVQHDIPGLVELMGGRASFEKKLDSLFFLDVISLGGGFHGDVTGMIGQYAHGNEPSHHVAYLYNYTDNPYKGQELIRRVFDQFYLPTRDGLSGNDDCGQMSTWYIFSALGFYPVDPVSGEYIIGAPQFKEMKLHLPNGKSFEMKAKGISSENKYIKSVKLNGEKIKRFSITYDEIMEGGQLEFEMTSSISSVFYD